MYESLLRFPGDLFAEFDRLQRELQQMSGAMGMPSSIRAVARGAFPAVNIGSTSRSVEIYAFASGIEPAKLEVSLDRGLLTLAGERKSDIPEKTDRVSVYAQERFSGAFKRVISLPEDADPTQVEARYQEGVLWISVQRRESAQPRRIEVK